LSFGKLSSRILVSNSILILIRTGRLLIGRCMVDWWGMVDWRGIWCRGMVNRRGIWSRGIWCRGMVNRRGIWSRSMMNGGMVNRGMMNRSMMKRGMMRSMTT